MIDRQEGHKIILQGHHNFVIQGNNFNALFVCSSNFFCILRNEERAGTPTIDEPGMGVNVVTRMTNVYTRPTIYAAPPPVGSIQPIMGLPQPAILQVC